MLCSSVLPIIQRELRAVQRTIDAYPDDASLWVHPKGLPNSGGTLVLHMAGNLQHFFGAILGNDGYKRNRDAEFARRDVSRAELTKEINGALAAVERGIQSVTPEQLMTNYPEPIAGRSVTTGDFIVHLAVHLGYHLGQLDYHRRVVTGDGTSINALSPKELPVREEIRRIG